MLVTIPKALRDKLGEEGATALIELLNNSSDNTHESVITLAGEKFERRLSEEIGQFRAENAGQIANLRAEFYEQIAGLRSEFFEEISKLRSELLGKIEENKSSTIRWMFLFWVGQIGTLIGILFAFFR